MCGANYTDEQKFRLPPVTSLNTQLTYRNKFCAQCHNDTDIQAWTPNIYCDERKVELNYLNSFSEIISKVEKSNCSMTYKEFYKEHYEHAHWLRRPTSIITCGTTRTMIGECNVTGTWQQYDANIKFACTLDSEYSAYYDAHRNIFCKICNPPAKRVTDIELIDGSALNAILEVDPISDACLLYEETPWLHPYKNVFCFFLSMRNENREPKFFDTQEKVTMTDTTIQYSLEFETGDLTPLLMSDPNFDMRNREATNSTDMSMNNFKNEHKFPYVTSSNKKVDIEKLLHLQFLHYGLQERCNMKINISETDGLFVQNCGCGIDCIYSHTCCADFALSKPISLISVFGESRYLIDRCYGQDHSYGNISSLCEDDGNANNLLSLLPIIHSNNHFKNVYCLACNNDNFTYNDSLQFMSSIGSDFYTILCDFFPNINPFFASLHSLMDSFIQIHLSDIDHKKCSINSTRSGFEFHGLRPHAIQSCNVTGRWQTYDADIEWACHNYQQVITPFSLPTEQFNNIFCRMCNMDDRLIHSENNTTEEEDGPQDLLGSSWYTPDFCKVIGFDLYMTTINVYRTLFSVTSHINLIPTNLQRECTSSEVLDQHTVCIFVFTCTYSAF